MFAFSRARPPVHFGTHELTKEKSLPNTKKYLHSLALVFTDTAMAKARVGSRQDQGEIACGLFP